MAANMHCEHDLEAAYSALTPNESGLKHFFDLLPDEHERAFEVFLTRLIEKRISGIDVVLRNLLQEESNSERIRFSAFYALCIYYRRYKDTSRFENVIHSYQHNFCNTIMYNHVFALLLKAKGGNENLETALEKLESVLPRVRNNAGVFHNYSECVATAIEEEVIEKRLHLGSAVKRIQQAIRLDPNYAKYYCTFGRLLCLSGDYKKAKRMIRKAIDLEDSQESDYAVRLSDYQDYLSRTVFVEYSSKLAEKIDRFEKEANEKSRELSQMINKALTKNLEFLGFFAALVGLIVSGVHILNNQPFEKAMQLIVVLMGGLLCVFSGFVLLIREAKDKWLSVLVFILGLILLLLSFELFPFL